MWTPFRLVIDNDCFFYSLIVLAHFRHKQLVDFSTYNTQILCLTCAIIKKAHYKDKCNYVQDCGGICPLQSDENLVVSRIPSLVSYYV
jgi:hypothetical protein